MIRSRGSGGVGRHDDVEDDGIFLGAGSHSRILQTSQIESLKASVRASRHEDGVHEAREPPMSMFQIVHVVSMDDVTMRLGAFLFQEKLVSGAPEDWF